MDKALKSQVISAVKETYLKELNNKYNGLLRVTCHDLIDNLLGQYNKTTTTTTNLKSSNHQINNPIDSSLTIDKYFERIDECVQ